MTYIQCTTSLIFTSGLKTLSAELVQEHEMHAAFEPSSRIVGEMVQEDDYTSWICSKMIKYGFQSWLADTVFCNAQPKSEEITKNTGQLDEQEENMENITYMDNTHSTSLIIIA